MIDQIVTAVLGGVAASASKVTSKAFEGAYAGLKGLIARRLGDKAEAVEALAKLEANPDSEGRKATLAEDLATADIAGDPEVLGAARLLQGAPDELPAEERGQAQQALGRYIAQASGGSTATVNVGRGDLLPNE